MANSSNSSGGNQFVIDTTALTRWGLRIGPDAEKEIRKFIILGLKESADVVQHREAREVPRGVSGKLAKSIHQLVTEVAATIGPDHKLKYAYYVEKGTKPHMPPVDALKAWAESKGINPWAVAKSIAQKGTKANPFVERTYKGSKDDIKLIWERDVKLIRDFLARV